MTNQEFRGEIASKLRKRSSLILATDTDVEEDRYGDPVMKINISAVKVGGRCILIHHARNGDCLVVNNVESGSLLQGALAAHRDDYGDAEVVIEVDDAANLPDRTLSVGRLLDGLYEPPVGLPVLKPSDVLRIITSCGVAESCPDWAWFDETFFLTRSVLRRTGMFNGRDFFDESMAEILTALGFRVRKFRPCKFDEPLSLASQIRLSEIMSEIRESETSIAKKESEIQALYQQTDRLGREVTLLKKNLPRLRGRYTKALEAERIVSDTCHG